MSDLVFRSIQPQGAISAYGRRAASPTQSYSWLDVWQKAHADGFTVAKSAGYDILDDLSSAIDGALKNGTTFDDFVNQVQPILASKGWWGTGPAFDPATGLTSDAQLGSLRRLRTIWDTNLRVSYQAGKWADVQRNVSDRPYLMYDHTTSAHPRIEHLAWDGITLPADDPWWDTHYPPNGWGCHCGVIALSQRQFDQMSASGLITTSAPKTIWKIFNNARTGDVSRVPAGIDPGFGYNVGKAFLTALAA